MKAYTHCPFCKEELYRKSIHERDDYQNLECRNHPEDHTYIQRSFISSSEVMELTVRVGEGDYRQYIIINWLGNFTQFWSGRFNNPDRITLHKKTVSIDFTRGIEATKQKIKTFITFS